MYIKEAFKKTSIFHIVIGVLVILNVLRIAITLGNIAIIEIALPILIGALLIYLGIKVRKADRKAVLALLVFNALQVFNFNLGVIEYVFLFGPHFQIEVIDWAVYLGFSNEFGIAFKTGSYANALWFFRINLIQLAVFIYLADQIRFIPKKANIPWEKELAEKKN